MSDAYAVKIRSQLPKHLDGLTPHAGALYEQLGEDDILVVARLRVASRSEVDDEEKPNVAELAVQHVEMLSGGVLREQGRELLMRVHQQRTGRSPLPFDPATGEVTS